MPACFSPATPRVRSPASICPSMAAGRCCERVMLMTERMLSPPPVPSHGDAFVKLDKVTLTYGRGDHQLHALDETDLTIDKGDFVALVGPSGCGKSTIRKLVTGLIPATNGYVFVAGREVGAEPVRVGMAFQNPTLLPWLKLRDNVMLPLKIVPPFRQNYRAKRKTEFRDRIEALLEQVGLKGFRDQYPC